MPFALYIQLTVNLVWIIQLSTRYSPFYRNIIDVSNIRLYEPASNKVKALYFFKLSAKYSVKLIFAVASGRLTARTQLQIFSSAGKGRIFFELNGLTEEGTCKPIRHLQYTRISKQI